MDSPASHYEVLGVPRDATMAEVRAAFRKLAKAHHPDRNADDSAHEKAVMINAAYAVLSNPQKRALYDRGSFELVQVAEDPREAWRRDFLRRHAARRRAERIHQQRMEARIMRVMRILTFPIFCYAAFLVVDYLLPSDTITEFGERRSYRRGYRTSYYIYYIVTPRGSLAVSEEMFRAYDFKNPPPITVYSTPIMKEHKYCAFEQGGVSYSFTAQSTIYVFYFPFILFASAAYTLLAKKYTSRRYHMSFMPILLLGVMLLFIAFS